MDRSTAPILAIGAVLALVYWLDRKRQLRAKQVRTSWSCYRCNKDLGPMQSAILPVAGGSYAPIRARFCKACATTLKIRNAAIWLIVVTSFVATFAILYLAS